MLNTWDLMLLPLIPRPTPEEIEDEPEQEYESDAILERADNYRLYDKEDKIIGK